MNQGYYNQRPPFQWVCSQAELFEWKMPVGAAMDRPFGAPETQALGRFNVWNPGIPNWLSAQTRFLPDSMNRHRWLRDEP
jgi:hypothetical protein